VYRLESQKLHRSEDGDAKVKRVLIYGAGAFGSSVAQMFGRLNYHNYKVVGFIDNDPRKCGVYIRGLRVLGNGAQLKEVVAKHQIDEVIVAITNIKKETLHGIFLQCREAGVQTKIMPSLLEIMQDRPHLPRDINVEDLLGRDISVTSIDLHKSYIRDKTVLVTGAGGSIGSELSRQICNYKPKHLILLGRGENRIHWIYLQLKDRHPDIDITPSVENITVRSAMESVFDTHRPDIVFHTAAHKHVYLMEYVPAEAVRNNILGTQLLAEVAERYNVERFVFVSTDKAVEPNSVMGATKRVCELMLAQRPYVGTSHVCVRFGNVLGSDGSVLEIFKRQWHSGLPLTITDPEATRYFMSIAESSFLVLQAGALGNHSDTFVLNMGTPVSIKRLAEEFIILNGGNPHDKDATKVIGLYPGEKLHEGLTYHHEELLPTEDENIMRVESAERAPSLDQLEEYLRELQKAAETDDNEAALRILTELTGNNLGNANREFRLIREHK